MSVATASSSHGLAPAGGPAGSNADPPPPGVLRATLIPRDEQAWANVKAAVQSALSTDGAPFARPVLAEIDSFVSDAEATAICACAQRNHFAASTLRGGLLDSAQRSSDTVWLNDASDRAVAEISARVSALVDAPKDRQEALQVVKYTGGVGGAYFKLHFDEGSNGIISSPESGPRFASDGSTGVEVVPRRGKAVIWRCFDPRKWAPPPESRHEAMPVLKGIKMIATKWVHVNKYVA